MGSKHGHPGADGGGLKRENVHSLSNKVKEGYCLSRFRLLYQKCHNEPPFGHTETRGTTMVNEPAWPPPPCEEGQGRCGSSLGSDITACLH